MKKVLLISFLLFFFTISDAGISTKKKDILKLIGTSFAMNGKFTWIELNGEDYSYVEAFLKGTAPKTKHCKIKSAIPPPSADETLKLFP
jgi:hypothetical protein